MTESETREYLKQERLRFKKWRDRAIAALPELSARVFALRKTGYKGCGFHWALEKSLGYNIGDLNNYDKRVDTMGMIAMEVCYSGLFKDVARIENELKDKNN